MFLFMNSRKRSSDEVVVELSGGLANQLFQWAVGALLAAEYERRLVIDARVVTRPDARGEQLRQFGITLEHLLLPNAAERGFWRIAHKTLPRIPLGAAKRIARYIYRLDGSVVVRDLRAARSALLENSRVRMRGLFQECDFLYDERELVKQMLGRHGESTDAEVERVPYAALHIRRGDYVSVPKYAREFGACSEGYYAEALSLFNPNLPVVLVSDDTHWSTDFRNRIDDGSREIRIAQGADHISDFDTLARSEQIALSNSTFSWWAAYLSDATKIICPAPWFNDNTQDQGLARSDWIKLAREQ